MDGDRGLVAVNEKGEAGEALRMALDRQLYREFLAFAFRARLPLKGFAAYECIAIAEGSALTIRPRDAGIPRYGPGA
jgi:hypothetical protein